MLFRESVIHFLVGETEADKQKRQQDEFCKACKAAGKNINCADCSRQVQVKSEEAKDER